MCSSSVAAFRKHLTCPPAETLLAYRAGSLQGEMCEQVTDHLLECEFCGAELQLLNLCPPTRERSRAVAIPPHLKNMFEEFAAPDQRGRDSLDQVKKGRP